jgi:hypothetical protein
MNRIRASVVLSTIMLLAGSAFAWQYPGGGGSQTPQAPQSQGSMQPGQSSPSTQPSQNQGAMQPGQSSSQQAQPGDQSQQQGSAQSGQAPGIDNQVQILAQQLNLSADQQAKIKTVLEDQHTQAMTIVHDQSLQREDKVQKIHTLRESTIQKVRATLTSDDQKQKFDQMVQAQDDRMRQNQQSPQTPPQPKQ